MSVRVVITSDGKRGHENQSRVVARMLGDHAPLVLLLRERVRNGGAEELAWRLRLRLAGPAALAQPSAAQAVQRLLQPEDPAAFREFAKQAAGYASAGRLFTISTGTPPATCNLILARLLGAKPLACMTPSLLPRQLFTLSIVPQHDLPGADPPGVASTPLALGCFDAAAAALLAGTLCVEYGLARGRLYWGVAVGGPSKACPWHGDRVLDELAELYGLAKGQCAQLLVTTSRRTPEYITAWIKQHFQNSPHAPYVLDASADPLNPLPAFYDLCQRMFVTGDSFSMVSEAVHAGHTPVILRTSPLPPPGKLTRALAGLAQAGQAVLALDDEESLALRVARQPEARGAANAEYERLRGEVRSRLGLDT
jgi:hypothetical protein